MKNRQNNSNIVLVIVKLANPVFVVFSICLPIATLIFASLSNLVALINYVHIMTGVLWTGIDLFMGIVIGPILGSMEPRDRVGVIRRLVPKMTFLMPVLAGVTTTAGIQLSQKLGILTLSNGWILASLIIVTILTLQGFGIILPNEIRVFKQLLSEKPDIDKIARLGLLNARLSGLQGLFQLAIIFAMANIRF